MKGKSRKDYYNIAGTSKVTKFCSILNYWNIGCKVFEGSIKKAMKFEVIRDKNVIFSSATVRFLLFSIIKTRIINKYFIRLNQ